MKISLYVDYSDLFPEKGTLIDKLNNIVNTDEKHKMYKTKPLNFILESLKKAGLDGFELRVPKILTDKNTLEIKNTLKKNNLAVLKIHQSNSDFYNIDLAEIQRLCEIVNKFSAEIITLHSDALGKKLFDDNFIAELKKLQSKHKVKFGIENMPKSPFSLFKTYTYKAKEFSSLIKNKDLFMTFDTTHLSQAGSDICEFFKENKERIVNIHLSDFKKNWLNQRLLLTHGTHLPLTTGKLPILDFLKLLKKESYQGQITMEINAGLEKLCESTEMIKNALE